MFTVDANAKALLLENYRQIIDIQFPNNGVTIELTERDIVQNSFKWDRYCATGDMLELGTAVSAEIEFSLRNDNGYFFDTAGNKVSIDDIKFEGKELAVKIGIKKWDAHRWENAQTYWFPIGKFTIMSMPHKFSTIKISALDRMTWFDLFVPMEQQENPFQASETLHSMVDKICTACKGISYSFPNTLPNYDMVVDTVAMFEEAPQVSYRQIIQWIAALTGTCAYIDVGTDNDDPKLVFRWLETAEGVTLTPGQRYSSTVYEPVAFNGLDVEKNDKSLMFGEEGGYHFVINNNSLIQGENWIDNYQESLSDVWTALTETLIPYRPFDAVTMPMPYLEPLDIIAYKDNDGSVFNTLITRITFSLNGATSISAVGVSETEALCATTSGNTSRQDADLKAIRNEIAMLQNATAAARERLTSMVQMALGLHLITVTNQDGSVTYYFTTAAVTSETPTLEEMGAVIKDSDVIYMLSGAGWVWCSGDKWNTQTQQPDGGWSYGITKDGTAVLGLINTSGININDENTEFNTAITPESFSVFQGMNLVFGFNARLESQINRLLIKSNFGDSPAVENNAYIRLGNAKLIPADDGLDIVYVEDI